jgi:hypothetical protein
MDAASWRAHSSWITRTRKAAYGTGRDPGTVCVLIDVQEASALPRRALRVAFCMQLQPPSEYTH